MSHFTSVEEFLEKRTDKVAFVNEAVGAAAGVQLSKLMEALKSPWGIAAGLGAGALGATGLWHAMRGDRAGDTLGYKINKGMYGLLDRIQADETAGSAFASGLGKETAKSLVGLTMDTLGKGYDSLKDTLSTSPVRKKIFNILKSEDDVLAQASNKELLEAYHTMSKFAPTLSTDKNAVKSFLRTAVTSGGGVDFASIKMLADAEAALRPPKGK